MEEENTTAHLLARLRKEKGLTQKQAAKVFGVPFYSVHTFEESETALFVVHMDIWQSLCSQTVLPLAAAKIIYAILLIAACAFTSVTAIENLPAWSIFLAQTVLSAVTVFFCRNAASSIYSQSYTAEISTFGSVFPAALVLCCDVAFAVSLVLYMLQRSQKRPDFPKKPKPAANFAAGLL